MAVNNTNESKINIEKTIKDGDSDEIKKKVSKIFDNFAKYSKNEKDFILSQQSLIKILRYINILNDKDIKLCDIDVLLKKVCVQGTKLNQEQFLDFMAHLSFKLDAKNFVENPKETISNIVKIFFDPFIEYLEKQNLDHDNTTTSHTNLFVQLSIPNFVEKFEIDPKMITLISSIYLGLKDIYQLYFHYEVNDYSNHDQILKESFTSYLEFCKDFELTPYLINTNQVVCYWNYIIDTNYTNINIFEKELGKVFTLNKFAVMMIHFSIMTFTKVNHDACNFVEIGKI